VVTFSVKSYEFDPSLPTGVELPTISQIWLSNTTAVYTCFPTGEASELIAI